LSLLAKNILVFLPSVLFFVISLFLTFSFFYTNLDVGWHIQMARFLEQGKSLYGDVVEVNFPIIYYSKLIPNFFADLFSIEEVIATEIFHILLGLFSYFCCLNIIQNYTKNKFFQILLISAIGFVIFILPYGIYRNQFGQKEFYFVILTLPYVIFRIFYIGKDENQTSSNFRFFIGFVAGLGVCTKPYFIIPFALFEIYCLVRTKSIKKYFSQAELLGCALSGISFLVIFMLFFFDDYYNYILPIIKYTYYTHSHFDAIYFERIFLKESIIFLLLIYYFKDNYHLLLPIALLHVGSFFITMIQHRSIDSVKYLMYSFEIIFLAIICFCALSRIHKNKNFIIPIITLILVGFSIFKIINNLHDNIKLEQNNIKPNHEDFNNYLASLESDNIFMLAPRLGVAFPAYLNLNINWN
jgi:hypothetical protein